MNNKLRNLKKILMNNITNFKMISQSNKMIIKNKQINLLISR